MAIDGPVGTIVQENYNGRTKYKCFKIKTDFGEKMLTNQWVHYNNNDYYVDIEGKMVTNYWIKDSKGWCYLKGGNYEDGAGQWDKEGTPKDGKRIITYRGTDFEIDITGRLIHPGVWEWDITNNGWRYLEDGNYIAKGWRPDEQGWLYLGKTVNGIEGYAYQNQYIQLGSVHKGEYTQDDKGNWQKVYQPLFHYMDENGREKHSSWISDANYSYYIKPDGYLAIEEWDEDYLGREFYFIKNNNELGYKGGALIKDNWVREYTYTGAPANQNYNYTITYTYAERDGRKAKNTWRKDSTGWCYLDESGNFVKTGADTSIIWKVGSYTMGEYWINKDGYLIQPGRWVYGDTTNPNRWWYRIEKNNFSLIDTNNLSIHPSGEYGWAKNTFYPDTTGWCYLNAEGAIVRAASSEGEQIKINEEIFFTDYANHIIFSQWIKKDNDWYYTSETGSCFKEKPWLDTSGRISYLTLDGKMARNWWKIVNGTFRYFDVNGYPTIGWQQYSSNWYYFLDNNSPFNSGEMAIGWKNIGNKWYYFNKSDNSKDAGYMVKGWRELKHYTSEYNDTVGWYYFLENGTLNLQTWLKLNKPLYWKLATEEEYRGFVRKDYSYYSFKANGRLQTGWRHEMDGDKIVKSWYACTKDDNVYINANGATQTAESAYLGVCVFGWYKPLSISADQLTGPAGTTYEDLYYFDDVEDSGKVLTSAWRYNDINNDKNSHKYWLGEDGSVYKGGVININEKWYYLNDSGILVTTPGLVELLQDHSETIYIKEDSGGELVVGWKKVGPDWYFFEPDTAFAKINSWQQDTHGWCYLGEDGKQVFEDFIEEGNKSYYIDDEGYLVQEKWAEANINGKKEFVYADVNGALVQGWIFSNNNWYYTAYNQNNYPVRVIGKLTINDLEYYFDSIAGNKIEDGVLLQSEWFYDPKDDNPLDRANYKYAGEDGAFAINRWIRWKEDNSWTYLGSDGRAVKLQWAKDSVDWCYLGEDGAMVTERWVKDSIGECYINDKGYISRNVVIEKDGTDHYIGENGYLRNNEWIEENGEKYFLKNGMKYIPTTGSNVSQYWVFYQGDWYYLNNGGTMATDKWAQDSKGWCYVGDDGKMLRNTWKQDSTKEWFYIGSDGRVIVDKDKIDGARFCRYIDGFYYLFKNVSDINNTKIKYSVMMTDQWAVIPDTVNPQDRGENGTNRYYFIKSTDQNINGKGLPFKWQKVNEKWQARKENNQVWSGWAKDIEGLRYTDSNGYAIKGWIEIENKWYYFNDDYYMVTNSWAEDSQGWRYLNSKGNPVKNSERVMDEKTYIFDEEGYWIG